MVMATEDNGNGSEWQQKLMAMAATFYLPTKWPWSVQQKPEPATEEIGFA